MVFSFLENRVLEAKDLQGESSSFYIDNFIAINAITMIYSPANQGKTFLTLAICKHILKNSGRVEQIFYLDMDNGKRTLKQRNVDLFISEFEKIKFIIKSSLKRVTPEELLQEICKEAGENNYRDCIFVFDSTRNFIGDINSHQKAKAFMDKMQKLRDAGATVLLIHHMTKSGKAISGSGEITNSLDNLFHVRQIRKYANRIDYSLRVEKERDCIRDMEFSVEVQSLELGAVDREMANLIKKESVFLKKALLVLKQNPEGMNKSAFLLAFGCRRDDKSANKRIETFMGVFWKQELSGREKLLKLL
jgi:archaellum biogenesis ATPase FlaH